MSCIDLKQDFQACLTFNPHQSSQWSQPAFMKSCNQALIELQTVKMKINQMEAAMNRKTLRSNPELENKMLRNLGENIKICQNHLKRLQIMEPDMKCSDRKFSIEVKNSILTTIEMKMLQSGIKFKQIYRKNQRVPRQEQSPNQEQSSAPNLSRPLFIDQSQQEIMQEMTQNQYKSIQKSMAQIAVMYQETAAMVQMHKYMIDSIKSDIEETEVNVDGGKKHLTEAHRRESKNRPLIKKIFAMLYAIVTIYIVFLS